MTAAEPINAQYQNGQHMLILESPVMLDLACGQNKAEGFIGVDAVKCDGVDYTCDLSQAPWHFTDRDATAYNRLAKKLPDGSVDAIRCSHFFEHLDGEQRIGFMNEMYRVLKHLGQAEIIVPYGLNIRAVQDPTHKWPPVVENSFLYFYRPWMVQNGLDHYPIRCNFFYTFDPIVDKTWDLRSEDARNFAMHHYNNVVVDLRVVLTKLEMDEVSPPD